MKPESPELVRLLREHGLRSTKARRLILSIFNQEQNHLNVEEILEALRRQGQKASPATLYQNLVKFVEKGLLIRFQDSNGLMRFDSTLLHHNHLICSFCGCIVDVAADTDAMKELHPVSFRTGEELSDWEIEEFKLNYEGICPDCLVSNAGSTS